MGRWRRSVSSSIQDNGIKIINDFLTDQECNDLISYIDNVNDSYQYSIELRKMSFNADLSIFKIVALKCLNKAKELFNTDELYVAEYLLSYYETGFSMEVHSDLADEREHFEVTSVVYLNENFTGGDVIACFYGILVGVFYLGMIPPNL